MPRRSFAHNTGSCTYLALRDATRYTPPTLRKANAKGAVTSDPKHRVDHVSYFCIRHAYIQRVFPDGSNDGRIRWRVTRNRRERRIDRLPLYLRLAFRERLRHSIPPGMKSPCTQCNRKVRQKGRTGEDRVSTRCALPRGRPATDHSLGSGGYQ